SPWGRGRPGWHIECSAMSLELLGESFDIHGGGLDLQFPHHENEIAQSACAHPHGTFARYWLHNEMLQVEGKKMSKSLGNFFTVRDLLEGNTPDGVKYPGEVIRFVFLMTHYRSPMDWTAEKARQAAATLRNWAHLCLGKTPTIIDEDVLDALADDLNTAAAISTLSELYSSGDAGRLLASAQALGLDLVSVADQPWARLFEFETTDGEFLKEGIDYQPTVAVVGWGEIADAPRDLSLHIVHRWLALRRSHDFAAADALRSAAAVAGVELRATRSKNGVNGGIASLGSDFDPAKLEALK
ncbi:MAG: cysteine--tRNA ligase, partial [Paracoccaceae bacterium]